MNAILIFLVIVCEKVAQVHVPAHAPGCRAGRAAAAESLQPISLNSPGDPSPVHVPSGSVRGTRPGIGAAWSSGFRFAVRFPGQIGSRFSVRGLRPGGRDILSGDHGQRTPCKFH